MAAPPAPGLASVSLTRHVEVAGAGTYERHEYRHVDAAVAGPPRARLIFYPGNPGVAEYYTGYLSRLHAALGGRVAITALGHRAHAPGRGHWGHGDTDLAGQLNHQHTALLALLKREEEAEVEEQVGKIAQAGSLRPPLVLAGHSIGAYMALEMLRRLQAQPGGAAGSRVLRVLGIHPFLQVNGRAPFQMAALTAALLPPLQAALTLAVRATSGGLSLLPPAAQRTLLASVLRSMDPDAAEVTRAFATTPRCVRQFVHMGTSEMRDLRPEPDWAFLRAEALRITLVYSGGVHDHWAPDAHRARVSEAVPDLTLDVDPGAWGHAFCCTEAGAAAMAERTAGLLRALPGWPGEA